VSLHRERVHFVLSYKRLERGRFRLPEIRQGAQSVALDPTALTMLLDGIDVRRVRRPELWKPKKCEPSVERGSTQDPIFDPRSGWHLDATSKRS
jgi:transposase